MGSRGKDAVHGSPADKNFPMAVALMATAAALNAVDTLLVRVISTEMSAFSIAFFRSAFGLLFVAPWLWRRRARIAMTSYRWMHLVRAGLKVLALAAYFYAISRANLTQVTAIQFTTPIFVIIGAVLILDERLGWARLLSVAMGFAGVLLILRPTTGNYDPYLLFALCGALLTAAIQLVLKAMTGRDPTNTLVAWNLMIMAPLALVPALFFWTTPSPAMLGLLAVQGALAALSMTAITRSVALADVSAVIPFDFLRLPLVALGAFYLFGQSADAGTWIGAAVIFLGVIIASRSPTARPVTVAAATDIDELDFVQDTTDTKTGKAPPTRVDSN